MAEDGREWWLNWWVTDLTEAVGAYGLSIPLPDGDALWAVLAKPTSTTPVAGWRGAVVVHEVFGVAPEMLDVADRFEANGWVAVVPDLFSHGTRVGCRSSHCARAQAAHRVR
jgi:dienelactone hydrolase